MTVTATGSFDNTVFSSNFLSQAYGLSIDHDARISKYSECWDFYNGDHWSKSTPEGYDQVTINYSKAFVKKLRRFTFRNDWTISYSEEFWSQETADAVRDVWEQNDLHDITTQLTEFAGIFGDWFLYVQGVPAVEADDEKEAEEPRIRLTVLDPRYVYPEYNTLTGELEFVYVIIPYEERVFNGNQVEVVEKVYREVHTKDTIYIQVVQENGDVEEYDPIPNPIGRILIVHGVNQPIAGSNYGQSDIEDIIDSQKLLNEKVSDVSEIIDYHAAPITIIYGAKTKVLEKGANKVWSGLPVNARVENLTSEGNIDASMKFIDFLKQSIHELGNVPEKGLGKEREMSNTSAVALSLDLEPMIEVAEDKRFYFEKGIKQVNELIIDILEYFGRISVKEKSSFKRYKHDIEFGELLPRDRSAELDQIQAEISMKLETRSGALKRLGTKDIQRKIKEIDEERIAEAETDAKVNEIKNPLLPEQQLGKIEAKNNPFEPKDKDLEKAKKANSGNPVTHGEQVVKENVKQKS